MASTLDETDQEQPVGERRETTPSSLRSWWKPVFLALLGLIAAAIMLAWVSREEIAENFLADQLEQLGVPARYDIVSIGPGEQVIENVVIGDPANPDMTIERVSMRTRLRFGLPGVGRISLMKPRLYGSYKAGKLSFGSLDLLLFTESKEPFQLPDLDLALRDGRALIETSYGPVAARLDATGQLRDGFAGELAMIAPALRNGDCLISAASIYGTIAVEDQQPRFSGPLRFDRLECGELAIRVGKSDADLELTLGARMDSAEGTLAMAVGQTRYGQTGLRSSRGTVHFSSKPEEIVARYDWTLRGFTTPYVDLNNLILEGRARSLGGLRRIEVESDISGQGLRPGDSTDRMLADASESGSDTLLAPVLRQMRAALLRESRDSAVSAHILARKTGDTFSVVVPNATVRGGSGEALLSLSRFQLRTVSGRTPYVLGNFAVGGRGLPDIAGRMERGAAGQLMMRIRMAEYRAGSTRLALPELTVVQLSDRALGFAGKARLTGQLPGGRADGLVVPLEGNWSDANGLALWRKCTELRFDALQISTLVLDGRSLRLCPPPGGAIVKSGRNGLRIAGGMPSLDVAGRLGSTPIRIASGAIGVAWPGTMTARTLDVALGPAETASRFRISGLDARIGDTVSGTFEHTDVLLNAVPLDVLDASGTWRYAEDGLVLSNGSFRLEDREPEDRFQPLVANGASLRLAGNLITAEAALREPQSLRQVVRTRLLHDLETGRGSADLYVDGLLFDKELQPAEVSRLALGVIANAEGVVRGTGRIDWDEETVSSTGRFGTEALDFAAAFGPVQGLSGDVVFTDLLGMVTAPDQKLRIRAINPGIEVNDGVITFALRPDNILSVQGGTWPFLGGTLTLQPVTMALGSDETLRYTLVIEALDAARLVTQMELGNITATGTFDGEIPLVFDQNGGAIAGGFLQSRPPGGNVSYVGELTYEDLSAMANFAFDALRSVNYKEMQVQMDGPLEGEIITRVAFDGLSQGEGASRNFITRRGSVAKIGGSQR